MIRRIVIENVRPSTPSGDYPAKAVQRDRVLISADIFREGHDLVAARVKWRPAGGDWQVEDMALRWGDRFEGYLEPSEMGLHEFVIEGWTDIYSTWVHRTTIKLAAAQDVELELEEGRLIFEERLGEVSGEGKEALSRSLETLRNPAMQPQERLEAATRSNVARVFRQFPPRWDLTSSRTYQLWVDRPLAQTGAWYELFPRSEGGLKGVTKRIEAIDAMGFDILYLPPIHPIGRTQRKGRGGSLNAGPDDPGSPWAIGSEEGGHTAIHPELGTFEDFAELIEKAQELGMEIALDYALQCSADHPWLSEHPEWFNRRPDGSIMYAENPPKKYQDIYPLKFHPREEQESLWQACKQILEFWIEKGVKVFRVDNPHTKPLPFWEWVISEIKAAHPEVIFLAEAFTEARMMAKLSEVGFTQSYTNFAWMVTKQKLVDYVSEVALGPKADFMRPNFWPNTPDILTAPLREGPPAAFKYRLFLAATMSPSYGIYSGYELCENQPAEPNEESNEEYFHSEKFEVKKRDWDAPGNLSEYITRINELRGRHPCLARLQNIRFHDTDNDQVIAYSKAALDKDDVVLAVVNLDPDGTQEAVVTVDLEALGIAPESAVEAVDEINGKSCVWDSQRFSVRLDPDVNPAALFRLAPSTGEAAGDGAPRG